VGLGKSVLKDTTVIHLVDVDANNQDLLPWLDDWVENVYTTIPGPVESRVNSRFKRSNPPPQWIAPLSWSEIYVIACVLPFVVYSSKSNSNFAIVWQFIYEER
jgi:hypothetical protein